MAKSEQHRLSADFLIELARACIDDYRILELVAKELEFQYLPSRPYKELFKQMVTILNVHETPPTFGLLAERFKGDEDAEDLLAEIKGLKKSASKELLLEEFELFLKEVRFQRLYNDVRGMFNEGKTLEAIAQLSDESRDIHEFSLQGSLYQRVFKDFRQRNQDRARRASTNDSTSLIKVPFGIHPLDYYTRGGGNLGTSALFLGRSGGGKSTILRWIAINAARLGLRVVHFQAEGSEQECLDAYDAGWTAIDLEDIELGNIPAVKEKRIYQAADSVLADRGEIYVIGSKGFETMTTQDCDDTVERIVMKDGPVQLLVFDYLELFNVAGRRYLGDKGERQRREDIANHITNMAIKHNALSASATQAMDIPASKYNDPDFIMTRSDISEFKGAVKPFSFFVTINQTDDEYQNGIVRLHNEKLRKYKAKQTYPIYQSLDKSRFYDSKRTLQKLWDDTHKKTKKTA